jgi:PiT family inorganic phosphate transporter
LNDAQKTMGIIALALAGATAAGSLDGIPEWLSFLRIPELADHAFTIPVWIKATCALVMASGTMAGGWRIIRTLGHKMVKLQPMNGVAADIASSTVIITASTLGIPVSTTHNVSSAIMGVGAAKRANAIKWTIVERMVWAWLLTLPVTAALAWLLVRALRLLGGVS